jgi:pyrroloquinoline quinone biosynthesis protein B
MCILGCKNHPEEKVLLETEEIETPPNASVQLFILGTLQDAGAPHIACTKSCCADLFNNPDSTRQVISLGLTDHDAKKTFLFEATPDMTAQLKTLKELAHSDHELPEGIFLTHAHIGHYAGLMYLGKEAINASHVPVYAMPRMIAFLGNNGPWSQLVSLSNISLQPIINEVPIGLTHQLKVTPYVVPHRDEFSETVGYLIEGTSKKALFIPDIDKWSKWSKNIIDEIAKVDLAFLDATFFSGDEINTRDISQIPHPFISESMTFFETLSDVEKDKVYFIHFNHTNPVLDIKSDAHKEVTSKGFHIAHFGEVFNL